MTWLFLGLGVWIVIAIPAAILVGRAIREADARRAAEMRARTSGDVTAAETPSDGPPPATGPATVPFPPPVPAPRRRLPVVRAPITRAERHSSPRDSGVL